ncbi:MAG: hypothetical protein RL144_90 [Actinomycetota bacterium]
MRFEISGPDRFVVGTVGAPGERAFFVQVRKDRNVYSVAIEKDQVRAIVSRLEIIISEIKRSNPFETVELTSVDDAPLDSPVDAMFITNAISISWDNEVKLIKFEFFEASTEAEEPDEQVLSLSVNLGIAQSFALRSKAVVNAGRLPCPFCSIPIDPRGHLCPRANGYKR